MTESTGNQKASLRRAEFVQQFFAGLADWPVRIAWAKFLVHAEQRV